MKKIIGLAVCFCAMQTFAQVTKVGNDTLLDVAGWNTEWFGDASNGPSNEPLQYSNIKTVIQNTDLDVWGLAEVSNTSTFLNLVADLPNYDGVNSSFSQTQKMALLWKKSKFTMLTSGNVLTESTYSYAFASRPPLEVVLRTKDSLNTDTIYFYVVHLKANASGDNQPNYDRRKNAVGFLKTFLDTNRKGKKCIVLGDWNDDVDESVVYVSPSYLESPFLNFVNDSAHYFFASMQLSKAGENSYVSSQNMIDHQLMTTALKDSFYVKNSAIVMKQTASQITNYASTTSDHYPVLARYNLNRIIKPTEPTVGINELAPVAFYVYPNPAHQNITLSSAENITEAVLINIKGEKVALKMQANQTISTYDIADGLYMLLIQTADGRQATSKLLIKHD